jgi:acetyl-CoA carboxylase carboxyl transferase subunit alpha
MASRNNHYLPFEQPLKAIDDRIAKLEDLSKQNNMDLSADIAKQLNERARVVKEAFSSLSAWDRIQLARHSHRPQTADYIESMCSEFIELHGDRHFADDRAILTGLAQIDDVRVMLIGQHKGRDVNERSVCNFGSPQPEGYRKALLKMKLAEKLKLPIVCLIDTKGAAPDIQAEERGQSEAIARNLFEMSGLKVPIVCIVIGEGGSGGALGIGVGDKLLIQEFAYFSVISPEGCAAILWKDPDRKADAAEALKITAPELKRLGVVDSIVPEPLGGAHRDKAGASRLLKNCILEELAELREIPIARLLDIRYQKLRAIGEYRETALEALASLAAS